jgi:hypothetical protein
MSETVDAAFDEAYALYMQRVDYRDRLRHDDPERRYAQACVEASFEMYSTFSRMLRPVGNSTGVGPNHMREE